MPSRDVTQRVRERIRSASQLRFGERGAQFAVLAGILLVVLGVGVFIGVLDAVREVDDIAALDEPVLRALTSVRSPVATAVLTAITTVAGPVVLPVVVLVGALVWALVGKARWQASLLAGAMVVSTAVSLTVKAVVARPRPPLGTMTAAGVQSTYSFPSGHTIAPASRLACHCALPTSAQTSAPTSTTTGSTTGPATVVMAVSTAVATGLRTLVRARSTGSSSAAMSSTSRTASSTPMKTPTPSTTSRMPASTANWAPRSPNRSCEAERMRSRTRWVTSREGIGTP